MSFTHSFLIYIANIPWTEEYGWNNPIIHLKIQFLFHTVHTTFSSHKSTGQCCVSKEFPNTIMIVWANIVSFQNDQNNTSIHGVLLANFLEIKKARLWGWSLTSRKIWDFPNKMLLSFSWFVLRATWEKIIKIVQVIDWNRFKLVKKIRQTLSYVRI